MADLARDRAAARRRRSSPRAASRTRRRGSARRSRRPRPRRSARDASTSGGILPDVRARSITLCVAVLIAGCGDSGEPPTADSATAPASAQHGESADGAERAAPSRRSTSRPRRRLPDRLGPRAARGSRSGPSRTVTGEHVKTVGRRTEFESPTVFGVLDRVGDYAAVSTPYLAQRPAGLGPARPESGCGRGGRGSRSRSTSHERQAALRKDGEVVRSFPVSVGAPGYDTPTGRFAVTDTFRGDLNPAAYGCCALAISAIQPHVPSGWLGGNRIAIHGTTGALGAAISHGCVRAADDDVDALVSRSRSGPSSSAATARPMLGARRTPDVRRLASSTSAVTLGRPRSDVEALAGGRERRLWLLDERLTAATTGCTTLRRARARRRGSDHRRDQGRATGSRRPGRPRPRAGRDRVSDPRSGEGLVKQANSPGVDSRSGSSRSTTSPPMPSTAERRS